MVVTFDTAALTAYYISGAALSFRTQRALAKAELEISRGPAVIPPWKLPPPADEGVTKIARLLRGGPLINLDDPTLDRPGVDDNFKRLFALFKGLTKLQEIAEFSASDRKAIPLRDVLNRRFQKGLAELMTYVAETKIEGITLVTGLKENFATATTLIPPATKPSSFLGASVTVSLTDPLSGVLDETFFIDVTDASGSKTVTVDLSQMGDPAETPRTLDNVVDFINGRLQAAAVLTSLQRVVLSEDVFGIEVTVGGGETVSFRPDLADRKPAVFVAGTNGVNDTASGFVAKFGDLAAPEPNQDFIVAIDAPEDRDEAAAVAVDSQGNVYVVGTTEGNLAGQANPNGQDVYLGKFDSAGKPLFTRLLGARTGNARGFDLAVDSKDNVIIAGSVNGDLISSAIGGGFDGFVTKFDSSGQELFTHQFAPVANDSSVAVLIDSNDNIIVGGYVERGGPFPGVDARVTRLAPDGALVSEQTIGGVAPTRVIDFALAEDGNILMLTDDNGSAFVRKLGADGEILSQTNLGDLGAGGAPGGIAVDSTGVYVTGTTSSGALNGTAVNPFSGGTDAFLSRLDADGTIDFVTYLGTAQSERANGIAVADGQIFITGETTGLLAGPSVFGSRDSFLAKFNSAGTSISVKQFAGSFGEGVGNAIAIDPAGSSVVTRLGLSPTQLPPVAAETVTALSSVRAGQELHISVNGQRAKRITIGANDSFNFLKAKITAVLGAFGKTSLADVEGGRHLRIDALKGAEIRILAGREGRDALVGLGLKESRIFGKPAEGQTDVPGASVFALGLVGELGLLKTRKSKDADILLQNAMREVRESFDFLSGGDKPDRLAGLGPAPAYIRARIANFQAALDRLTAGQKATANRPILLDIFRI